MNDSVPHPIKGIYLMTEPGCLQTYSGAFIHITTGIQEFRKYVNLQVASDPVSATYLRDGNFVLKEEGKKAGAGAAKPRFSPSNKWWGLMRDLRVIYHNLKGYQHLYQQIKAFQPDFIYERAAYANINGLRIARKLGIPHFYEVNGVLAQDKDHHYLSHLRKRLLKIEKWVYQRSNLAFCVGGTGTQLGLKPDAYVVVQNGIDDSFLHQQAEHTKQLPEQEMTIHACFIGHLMEHHRIEYLFEAWEKSAQKSRWHFHFVGGGLFEQKLKLVPNRFPYTYHGVIPHDELPELMKDFQVGLIPHSQPEASYMKLYTYGSGKLLSVVPGWDNFTSAFSEDEVCFFEPENSDSLASTLDQIAMNPGMIHSKGEAMFSKVEHHYTWQKIFEFTIKKIREYLPADSQETLVV